MLFLGLSKIYCTDVYKQNYWLAINCQHCKKGNMIYNEFQIKIELLLSAICNLPNIKIDIIMTWSRSCLKKISHILGKKGNIIKGTILEQQGEAGLFPEITTIYLYKSEECLRERKNKNWVIWRINFSWIKAYHIKTKNKM